jgi:hypothetical protein
MQNLTRVSTPQGFTVATPLTSTQDTESIVSILVATLNSLGIVGVDGTTITISAQGILSAVAQSGGPTTQNNVTGSRVLSTVYRNTTGRALYLGVTLTQPNRSVAASITIYSDTNDPPTTIVAQASTGTDSVSAESPAFTIVLPGSYYMVTQEPNTSPPADIVTWIEWS